MLNQIIIINYFSPENYDQQVPLGPIPFFFPPDQPSGNKNRMAPGNLLYDHQAVAILRYVLLVFLSYTRSWDLIQDWEKGDPNDRSRLGWGRGIDNSLNLLPSFLFDPFFLPCDKTAPTEWLNTLIVVKIMRGWTESPEEGHNLSDMIPRGNIHQIPTLNERRPDPTCCLGREANPDGLPPSMKRRIWIKLEMYEF